MPAEGSPDEDTPLVSAYNQSRRGRDISSGIEKVKAMHKRLKLRRGVCMRASSCTPDKVQHFMA